jgi:hypothetical protein
MEAANAVLHRELLDGINAWEASQLMTLKGIGKQRAAKIVEMRGAGGARRVVRHLGELNEIGMTAKQIEALFLLNAGEDEGGLGAGYMSHCARDHTHLNPPSCRVLRRLSAPRRALPLPPPSPAGIRLGLDPYPSLRT